MYFTITVNLLFSCRITTNLQSSEYINITSMSVVRGVTGLSLEYNAAIAAVAKFAPQIV